MAVNLSALGGAGQQFFDNNGNPLSGGKLWSYAAGTTTPQTTYTTATGNVAHTNPIVLDSAGRVSTGEIWLTAGDNYKFVLMTSANVTLATWDNITGINGTGITSNANNVEYDPPFTGGQPTTVEAKLAQTISVKDFGAVGDGVTDDTNAWDLFKSQVGPKIIPPGEYLVNGVVKSYLNGVYLMSNVNDYASLGNNILPAFSLLAKTNFDSSGNHAAGTVGVLEGSIAGSAYSYYLLKLVISTTSDGHVKILQDGLDIFGDLPSGYYFSNVAVLNDGTENNQYVTTTDYYFVSSTSATASSTISVQTDTSWAGTISALEIYEITPTEFSFASYGADSAAIENPMGLKIGAYNRNDIAFGNKFTLGVMSYDGVAPVAAHNVAIGATALAANWKGDENTAIGTNALAYNEGSDNVAVGYSALRLNTKGQENTAIGYKAGTGNTTGYKNTFVGFWSGAGNATGSRVTRVGWWPNINQGIASDETSVGAQAGTSVLSGYGNCFFGTSAGKTTSGQATLTLNSCVGVGYNAKPWGNGSIAVGSAATVGSEGAFADGAIAIGQNTLSNSDKSVAVGFQSSATGSRGVAVGESSIASGVQSVGVGGIAQAAGDYTTAIGCQAGRNWTGTYNTFVGRLAGGLSAFNYSNCTLLGSNTTTTGSNQVQLGDSTTTTYAYGAVQNRSDARDKTEVRDTVLGLDFINSLRPVDFKWAFREDNNKPRTRYHHGLIAQEVKAACDAAGIDFGGYQDHSINGGQDVLSLGYEELIAPLIKAVQQLSSRIAELESK